MSTRENSALKFRSKRDLEERITFIKLYVRRLKENPDEVFRQQVALIDAFMESAKNFPLSRREYLKMKKELRD